MGQNGLLLATVQLHNLIKYSTRRKLSLPDMVSCKVFPLIIGAWNVSASSASTHASAKTVELVFERHSRVNQRLYNFYARQPINFNLFSLSTGELVPTWHPVYADGMFIFTPYGYYSESSQQPIQTMNGPKLESIALLSLANLRPRRVKMGTKVVF
jgi:hypothetical protein